MTFDEILLQMDTIPGYFWAEEARQLYDYAENLSYGSIAVESGILYGRSLSVLATVAKEKGFKLYAVENWRDDGQKQKDIFLANMQRLSLQTAYMLFEKESTQAAAFFEDKQIDLFHLDTDHLYDHSVAEVKAWMPKMKSGGIMCFHDYGNTVFVDGIKRAVDESDLVKLGVYNSLGVFRVP